MRILSLLGDSTLDNGAYVAGGLSVVDHVRNALPTGWLVHLLAVDGATSSDIAEQLKKVPRETTDLVLSVGGNDALLRSDIVAQSISNMGEALMELGLAVQEFRKAYVSTVQACLHKRLPLTVCTVYNGNFPESDFQKSASSFVALLDDAITSVALEHRLNVIDLRAICRDPSDFANPIEPSSLGGKKIAAAIAKSVTAKPGPFATQLFGAS